MSILDEALPPLEDLEPEELKYLREICKALKAFEFPKRDPRAYAHPDAEDGDGLFDADELGLDPEFDNERW